MASDCAELLRRRGLLHFAKGRRDEARKDLERAFALATVSEQSFAWKTLQQLRAAAAPSPEYLKLLEEARAFLAQQQPQFARVKAVEAGRVMRTRALFVLMGDISLALDNPQEAADFWTDAVKQLWDDALVVKLGGALWDDGRWEQAVERVGDLYARLLDPEDGAQTKAWLDDHSGKLAKQSLDQGAAHLTAEEFDDAKSAFLLAIRLRKQDPRGHFGLAQTYERAGAKGDAAKSYNEVIALTTGDEAEAAKSLLAAAKEGLARLAK